MYVFLMVHRHFLSLQQAPDTRGNDPGFRHTSHSCKIGWLNDSCSYHAFLKMRKFSLDAMRCHMSSYKYRYFQRSGWLEKNTKKEHLQLQLQKAQMTQDTDSRASRSCSPFAGAASSPWRRNMQPQRNILFTDFFTNS